VKTGDRETKDVGASSERDENVVRLPREWIGPLEELVPIRPATEAREQSAEIVGDEVPPAADAFWSEDAGALHNAVQAPPGAASGLPEPAVVPSRAAGTGGRLRVRLRPPWAALWSRCGRLRPAHMGAVAAVAVLVLVAAIGTLWESGPGGAPASRARHDLARVGNPGAQTRRPSIPIRGAAAEGAATSAAAHRSAGLDRSGHRVVSGRHRGAFRKPLRGHPRGPARRKGIHRSSPSPAAATAEPVAASTVNSGAASSYSPAGGALTPTTTTPPATTAPVSQSASGSGGSSASSGSSSSPAFGPSGALAPGSSPNS
jgi:hypothetical protein